MGVLKTGLRYAVTLGAMLFLAWLVDWSQFLSMVKRVSPTALLAATGLAVATHSLLAARWHLIAASHLPGGFARHFAVFWQASILGLFTPGTVGADAYRILILGGGGVSPATVAGLVIRERFIGLTAYLASYFAALPFVSDQSGALRPLAPAIGALLFAVTTAWLVLAFAGPALQRRLPARLAAAAAELSAGLRGASPIMMAAAFAITAAACATWFGCVYLLALALESAPPFALVALTSVLVELVRILPVSIQGIGVRESAFGYVFSVGGSSFEAGVATGMFAYLLYNMVVGLGGLAISFAGKRQVSGERF